MHKKKNDKQLYHDALKAYRAGKLDLALSLMKTCATANPNEAAIQSDLGGMLNVAGQLQSATLCLLRAIELEPDNARSHYNLGCTQQAMGLLDQAMTSYERANTLAPADAQTLCNMGGCLQELGKADAAIACYRKALAQNSDDINSLNNLGVSLYTNGLLDEAILCFEKTLALQPHFTRSLINLGMTSFDRGQIEKALAYYERALAIDPEYAEAHFSIGVALHAMHHPEEAIASYRRALAIKGMDAKTFSNLLMTQQFVSSIDGRTLLAEHKRFAEQFEAPLIPRWPVHANSRDPEKRLKIGYVSGDFRSHAVAYFIEPILAHHDKSQVETYCYSNNLKHDEVTERLIRLADHWQPCSGMTDDQLAQRITADGIDLLIDLSGHTAHNRLLTFARKPAPIQITYVGYLSTTGLRAMDYRLTDQVAEPEGSARYYTEKLLYLPDSTWCFLPPQDLPEISPLPALANGHLTFGSFNSIDKLGNEVIQLWAALLTRLPTSRLLLLAAPEVQAGLLQQFNAFGIDDARIRFCGKVAPSEYRRLMQSVDLTLDSFPVNGATTTCESLWQGVPVLSLAGQRLLSRNGMSILRAARLPDFAAQSANDLIATAELLADNLPLLASIRAGMRDHLLVTPLLDHERFTMNLENIYRKVWRNWCGPIADAPAIP